MGWLSSDKPLWATTWVSGLAEYLARGSIEGASHDDSSSQALETTFEQLDLSKHEDRHWILWRGDPFLLVGGTDEIRSFLSDLPDDSRQLLASHDYYWILSEPGGSAEVDDLLASFQLQANPVERRVAIESGHTSSVKERGKARSYFTRYSKNFDFVRAELRELARFPNLVGLSGALRLIRAQVSRVTSQVLGPWSPTLILGESGVGKTEVARALHVMSGRPGDFKVVPCTRSTDDALQDLLFGHVDGAFNSATRASKGLFELFTDGTLFLDAIDAAGPRIQREVLSILTTPARRPATFCSLGTTVETSTSVWIVIATDTEVGKLFREAQLALDFLFRCEDRVIHVPPLRDRLADLPALAKAIWAELAAPSAATRELHPAAIRALYDRATQWEGNVRALRTLLALVFSWSQQPTARLAAIGDLVQRIRRRGPEYSHWVGILTSSTEPLTRGDRRVQEILQMDMGSDCGPNSDAWPTTASEKRAEEVLRVRDASLPGMFKEALADYAAARSDVRPSVRLSRMLCFMHEHGDMSVKMGRALCGVGENTVIADLRKLTLHELVVRQKGKSGPARYRLS